MKKPMRKPPSAETTDKRDADALARVHDMTEPERIRALMANARRLNVPEVYNAAFRRLVDVQSEAEPGTVAHDFWRTVHAFEQMLKEERGKTIRLTRTRQKIARVGEVRTLADFADATKETQGFEMLIARQMPELTGEAIILRHPDDFDDKTRDAAAARLSSAGVDPAQFTPA
ncbi:hypothetical protein OCGS_0607 [Oceaniovalibus guishaninsula JLT2003]|uniref:Uncharacterized protein n=1 Tax=Oceaniovalibus guishaninsula JLT2003 TaxID=1231392 RepID=K2HGE1_9RHOB|nr:hypothetical protein [Oceaniovalibus guishaninsula]EKE45517.1 hypothetical protein OCGS_0607 [Oceaniovalibus guishaninsula JLT2003]